MKFQTKRHFMVERIFQEMPDAVLHGGALIWRCYGGNRFSQGLDFYSEEAEG